MHQCRTLWLENLLLAFLVGLVHFGIWSFGFISDDFVLLEAVQNGTWQWFSGFPAGSQSYWRPMVLLSFKISPLYSQMFHHGFNLMLHLGCVFWVRAICLQWNFSRMNSLLASFWFGIHWANVTDISWISGRTDLLGAFFFLLAFWALLQALKKPSTLWGMLCCLGYIFALTSKENTVVFLPIAAVIFGLKFGTLARENRPKLGALFGSLVLITGAYLLLLWRFFYGQAGTPQPINPASILINTVKNGFFIVSPLSPLKVDDGLFLWMLGLVLLLVVGLMVALCLRGQTKQTLSVPVGMGICLLISMLPTLFFLNQTAPRLLYLSLALSAVLVAWIFQRLPRNLRFLGFACLAVYTAGSIWESQAWRENQALANACSESMAEHLRGVNPQHPFVILGAPSEKEGILVFGNDMNQAFFYAAYGKFGRFSNASAVGQIGFEKELPRIERLRGPTTASFERKIQPPAAYLYGPGVKAGDIFAYGPGQTKIFDVGPGGRVKHFRFEFSDYIFAMKPWVFDFDGKKMVRLQ